MMAGIRSNLRTATFRRLACALYLAAVPGAGWADDGALTLRVNDATARPGGLMAVVIRTYAPRTLGQGQLCLRTSSASNAEQPAAKGMTPLLDLESFLVFSDAGDVVSEGTFDPSTQTALLAFESLSGTVNRSDGPLAVLFFRIAGEAMPGQTFEIAIDADDSFLVDSEGRNVALEPRAGDLEVVAPAAPFELAAEGDEVAPGGVARLGVSTAESFSIAFGRAAFHYDPSIAAGPPAVAMDPRHGEASFAVDATIPGRVIVAFTSIDASLNSIPGDLISIDLPISPGASVGLESPVSLDPDLTFLAGANGVSLPLALDADAVAIVPDEALFSDGFESGDLASWTSP